MSIPIPAETPDPNIDNPTIPPTEPDPVPEQEPPGTTPPLAKTRRRPCRR